MAELILSAVALGIAIPEFLKTLTKGLEQLAGIATKYRNAPQVLQEISLLARDLGQGKLTLNVSLAEWASRSEGLDPRLRESLYGYLQRLQAAITSTIIAVESLYDKDGALKRFYFSVIGERRLAKAAKKFHHWQTDFVQLIQLIEMEKRLTQRSPLLSDQELTIFNKGDGEDLVPVSGSKLLLLGKGEFKASNAGIQVINVLVERRALDVDEASIAQVATKLGSSRHDVGILDCIGHRRRNGVELVFRVPISFSAPLPLSEIIGSTMNGRIPYPLEARLELCRDLCRAVFSVHTSSFVHKNIRPENVLLFQTDELHGQIAPGRKQLGRPFLTDWLMLRTFDDLSTRRGAQEWIENIYRHPHRQGLQPQTRYNLGHDLYSLGVVLLEVALWESFIVSGDCPKLSQRYINAAVQVGHITPGTMDPARFLRKLTAPVLMQQTLLELAREEVPSRMGTTLSQLIVSCITCLEGGLGSACDFENSPDEVALRFHELVNESFVI
ncbi:serine threonine kinase 33 [Fusarium pseudoanthophilum]|uniref:Serine threonine kinase 33 n=1 Tax=Fusarium pseudoanthophilum TaxID=48495 RepID=A0A8H5V186_9HYPO|nr:serine threonine kinase 33 [Fusarium pseudoanthophilum]